MVEVDLVSEVGAVCYVRVKEGASGDDEVDNNEKKRKRKRRHTFATLLLSCPA